MKRSALKSFDLKKPQRNVWLTLLGPCVAVPHGARMAKLATYCARVRETQPPLPAKGKARQAVQRFNRQRAQRIKRTVATRLVALLWDSIADLNPERLEHFAAIVQRLREHKADPQPSLIRHEKALRLAEVAWLAGKPMTAGELIRKLGGNPDEHDEASPYRKAVKFATRYLVPDKRGAKKGTRKRET